MLPAPRTDPYVRLSRIRLPPRVSDGKSLFLRFDVCAPAPVTRFPGFCVRPECCWFAFPLVPALGSTGSAADRSALFASFAATTAGSDFPRSFIIGYRFSLPDADQKRDCPGQTRDLPSSDAILLRVICSSTPAGRAWPRLAALSVLRSTLCTVSAPATYPLRGSITHPTQPLCTLRGRRRRRLTRHSLPGCLLSITWVGLSPTDRASFAWRLRRAGPQADMPLFPCPSRAAIGRDQDTQNVKRAR